MVGSLASDWSSEYLCIFMKVYVDIILTEVDIHMTCGLGGALHETKISVVLGPILRLKRLSFSQMLRSY